MRETENRRIWLNNGLTLFLLVGLPLILYIPAFKSGFIWDDLVYINGNSVYSPTHPFKHFFSQGMFYRPLVSLTFVIDHGLFHSNPVGYHLTNILVHEINVLLVFFVLSKLIKTFGVKASCSGVNIKDGKETALEGSCAMVHPMAVAVTGALIFALHPVNTEPIAWISARNDTLATMFFLITFLCLIIYEEEKKTAALVLIAFFFLCALFSKENAISFIGIAALYGWLKPMRGKEFVLTIIALLIVTVLYFVMRDGSGIKELLMKPGSDGAFLAPSMSLYQKIKTLIYALTYYIENVAMPVNLSLMPGLPNHPLHLLVLPLPPVIAALLISKGRRLELFFLLWVFVTLAPSLIIAISTIAYHLASRYLYLPSVGFSFLAAFLLSSLPGGKKYFVVSSCVILIILAFGTSETLKTWHDNLTVWKNVVRKNPGSAIAHDNYGVELTKVKAYKEAEKELLLAYGNSDNPRWVTSGILTALGDLELRRGDYSKANDYLTRAIKFNPNNVSAYNYLGSSYVYLSSKANDKETQLKKAIDIYGLSLKLAPGQAMVFYNLGQCYFALKEPKKAAEYFNMVIETDPTGEFSTQALYFLMASQVQESLTRVR